MEELVHSLIERGDFEGTRGSYRIKAGIDTIPLPNTVQAVLSARIDRLKERSKQILQTAAVIGREVPITILERVSELAPNEVAQGLRDLRRSELLYEPPPREPGLHAFRHPLIQEVAYQSLLTDQRRKLHAAVASAIETQYKERAGEQAGLLAFHLEKAGEILQAAQANMRAAVWLGANDPSQALRTWRKVRDLLNTQPSDQSTDYLRMMACGQIINFGWREGLSAEEAKIYFQEAKQLALAANDMRANALIHAAYGRLLAGTGSADEYVTKICEAESLSKTSDDASLNLTLKTVLCHALRLSGRMMAALAANVEAMTNVRDIGPFDRQMLGFDVEPWLIGMRGQTLIILGRFDEAKEYLDRVIQMDAASIDITHHAIPSHAYVDLAWAESNARLATFHAERAFSLAMRGGSPYLRVYAHACRGISYTIGGRLSAAIEELGEALDLARRRRAGLEAEARILGDLANAYRLAGDLNSALKTVTEAIETAMARNARVSECLSRMVHAEVLWALTDVNQAREELSRAVVLMYETGALIFQPMLNHLGGRIAGRAPQSGNLMSKSANALR